jgi:hypothetical protein
MDTYTLELRQKDAISTAKSGDWESVVQEKILLEDGDTVVMKSAFIDTEASSNQKINIPKDLTLNFQWSKWWNFYFESEPPLLWTPPQPVAQGDDPDNQRYVESLATVGTGNTVGFTYILKFQTTSSQASKPFDLELQYEDITGEIEQIKVHVPSFQPSTTEYQVKLTTPLIFEINYGLIPSPNEQTMKDKYYVSFDIDKTIDSGSELFISPKTHSTSISIEKGAYSPVDLCSIINRKLTEIKQQDQSKSPLVLYGNKFLDGVFKGGYMVEHRAQFFQYPQGKAITAEEWKGSRDPLTTNYIPLTGTNTVELAYLDAQQKFTWNAIHFPIYDDNGTPSVLLFEPYTNIADTQTAYSGIFWSHLGAEDENGDYFDFWEGLLGFDLNKLYPIDEPFISDTADYLWYGKSNLKVYCPKYNLGFGETITGGLASIAGLVPTSSTAQTASKGFYNCLQVTTYNPTNSKNVYIEAPNSVLSQANAFGYFLIEINAKMMGKYITKDQNRNNISAIVSRYYEVNSYTSATESDALIYTHHGNPVFLESFKCRILDSDKNVASNLGGDNTVFLQVVKNIEKTDIKK